MASILKALGDPIRGLVRRTRRDRRGMTGTVGYQINSGYLASREKNRDLVGRRKWQTFDEMINDTPVISAGIRFVTALAALSKWSFGDDEQQAERAKQALLLDPKDGWNRVIRRAAMSIFYGYACQEWSLRRREDGVLTFDRIQLRPQHTIDRWDVDRQGEIKHIVQTDPNRPSNWLMIPRRKCLLVLDDTTTDRPDGHGILRQLVRSAQLYKDYTDLERLGVLASTGGTPIVKFPRSDLHRLAAKGDDVITPDVVAKVEKVLEGFVKDRVAKPDLGLVLDSAVWASEDETGRPSNTPQWDVQLLSVQNNALKDVGTAIERGERAMARLMGIEMLLLGGGSGSYALAKEQGDLAFLTIDSLNQDIADAVYRDMIEPLWMLNGWTDPPRPEVERGRTFDPKMVAETLKGLKEGTVPKDPAYNQIRGMMGVDPLPDNLMDELGGTADPMEDDPVVPPEEENGNGSDAS